MCHIFLACNSLRHSWDVHRVQQFFCRRHGLPVAVATSAFLSARHGQELSTGTLCLHTERSLPVCPSRFISIEVDTTPSFEGRQKGVRIRSQQPIRTWTTDVPSVRTQLLYRVSAWNLRAAANGSAQAFVNVQNELAPSVPSPGPRRQHGNDTHASSGRSPWKDIDGDVLTYRFEVADDSGMTHVVFSSETSTCSASFPPPAGCHLAFLAALAGTATAPKAGGCRFFFLSIYATTAQDVPPSIAFVEPSSPSTQKTAPFGLNGMMMTPTARPAVSLYFDTDGSAPTARPSSRGSLRTRTASTTNIPDTSSLPEGTSTSTCHRGRRTTVTVYSQHHHGGQTPAGRPC